METNYYVYKHTNKINGKVYIGITCQKPKQRWSNGKGYKKNNHFWNSIKKYGWNKGFDHEILYSGLSQRQAEVMEVSLIAYYDSTDENKGYNKSPGGGLQSEETRQKLSESHKGKNMGREHYASKAVICITTGRCFASTSEASTCYNAVRAHIGKCCNGKRKTAGKLPDGTKLTWKYISNLPRPNLTESEKSHLRDLLDRYNTKTA